MVRLRLKEVLEEKNISQSKLSRMADVSLNTIQEMIHNPYHDVRINTLDKIGTNGLLYFGHFNYQTIITTI